MAGMFYSLQEVAEKLNKSEEEVKEIIKQGKLREFRDGPNLLFKVDEVEALMSETNIMASKGAPDETKWPDHRHQALSLSVPGLANWEGSNSSARIKDNRTGISISPTARLRPNRDE